MAGPAPALARVYNGNRTGQNWGQWQETLALR
jgi:hypothetical protein